MAITIHRRERGTATSCNKKDIVAGGGEAEIPFLPDFLEFSSQRRLKVLEVFDGLVLFRSLGRSDACVLEQRHSFDRKRTFSFVQPPKSICLGCSAGFLRVGYVRFICFDLYDSQRRF